MSKGEEEEAVWMCLSSYREVWNWQNPPPRHPEMEEEAVWMCRHLEILIPKRGFIMDICMYVCIYIYVRLCM